MKQSETKEKILSDLYSIRAAMSLVSENDDRANAIQTSCDDAEKKVEERKAEKRRVISSLDEKIKGQYDLVAKASISYHDAVEKIIDEKQDKSFDYAWDSKHYRPWMGEGKFIFLILLMIGGALAGIIGGAFGWFGVFHDRDNPWNYVISFSVGLIPIVCFIITYIYDLNDSRKSFAHGGAWINKDIAVLRELLKKNLFYSKDDSEFEVLEEKACHYSDKEKKDSLVQIRKFVKARREEIQALEEQRAELREEVDELEKERRAIVQTFLDEGGPQMDLIALESKDIVDSAVKAFPVIDFRDWENTDLLIYYFETGRAENLKEALQLVDRQRQTDQITDAIDMAASAIEKTIQQSMSALGTALSISFDRLSGQLAKQHAETIRELELQTKQLSEMGEQEETEMELLRKINEQGRKQITAQEMTNALLFKIDRTSAELAEDMERQLEHAKIVY